MALAQYRVPVTNVLDLRPRIVILRRIALCLTLGMLGAVAVVAASQPGLATRVMAAEARLQRTVGVEIATAGIYLEESAIPMPVPSEVSIGYLGQRFHGNPAALVASWIGLTMLILLGSTNLFAVSRRFGPKLVDGQLGAALHLTPSAVTRAQRWFDRWGPLAIGVSRYVPGLRWGMAVACGTLGVSYRTFWLSTAVSASIWTAGLLTLGATLGDPAGRVIADHPWVGLLLPLPAAAAVSAAVIRLLVSARTAPASSPST